MTRPSTHPTTAGSSVPKQEPHIYAVSGLGLHYQAGFIWFRAYNYTHITYKIEYGACP